jgi:endonuclease/exonuclease/phosphatase family metal-dependent hydrolase
MPILTNDPGPLTRRAALRALAMAALCAAPLPLTMAHAAPAPRSRSRPRRQREAGTLRALTLNVWGLPNAPDRDFRMAHIADVLARGDYDLVAIQEAWLGIDRDTLRAGAARGGLAHDVFFDEGTLGTGLMLLSRYPLSDAAFTRYTLNGDPLVADHYVPKGLGFARVATPSGPLDAYVTHTIAQHNPNDRADRYRPHRVAQLYELTEQVNARSAESPLLVMGDLNARPDQFGYGMLLALTGLADGFFALHPDDPGYTYSVDNLYNPDARTRRLDYVLARDGGAMRLTPGAAEIVLKLIPITEGTPQPKAYSDHYGVRVDYALEPLDAPLPSAVPTGADVESTLREAAAALRDGLAEEKGRRPRRAVEAGVGLAGAAALYAAGARVEDRQAELGRALKGPGAAAAGAYALASGWLAAITSRLIVRGYESVLRRIDARLGTI